MQTYMYHYTPVLCKVLNCIHVPLSSLVLADCCISSSTVALPHFLMHIFANVGCSFFLFFFLHSAASANQCSRGYLNRYHIPVDHVECIGLWETKWTHYQLHCWVHCWRYHSDSFCRHYLVQLDWTNVMYKLLHKSGSSQWGRNWQLLGGSFCDNKSRRSASQEGRVLHVQQKIFSSGKNLANLPSFVLHESFTNAHCLQCIRLIGKLFGRLNNSSVNNGDSWRNWTKAPEVKFSSFYYIIYMNSAFEDLRSQKWTLSTAVTENCFPCRVLRFFWPFLYCNFQSKFCALKCVFR